MKARSTPKTRSAISIGMAAFVLAASLMPMAQGLGKKHSASAAETKATPPEDALRSYIAHVRAQQAAEVRTPGSIWSPEGEMVRLGTDVKAFRIHDVV